jgi:hypothetical protein
MFSRKHFVRVLAHDFTLEGVLVARAPDHYRLAAVRQIVEPGKTLNLDGEVEVAREKVLFLQRLGKAEL